MSSTRMAANSGLGVVAVRVVKDCVILYHWTAGWPTMMLPKARVLLPGRRAVPVPVRETKAGLASLPAVTERRP
jgi:hypothetical protein